MTRHRFLSALGAACVASGVALLAVGCTSTSRFDGPDGDRRLYEARCGFCHVPFAPADFQPDDWPAIVEDMGPRAGLNAAYRKRVTDYVLAESTRTWGTR